MRLPQGSSTAATTISPPTLLGEFIPKSSSGNEDFALRVTKTLILKVLSGLTSYESDTTVGVIRPDIENERFNSRKKLFKSFISNRQCGA